MEGPINNSNSNAKEEEEEEGARTRIYVGGLGEKVTSEDLQKMLWSLGIVEGVELVRTKGRSFAYIDFLPSSPKSLSKLFSTYNGCVWKGGRLRLEKAKEHYLVRLKREWAEDTQHASSEPAGAVDTDKNLACSGKSKKVLNSEKQPLQIFFPRLRKVKSLPFSGTGKHKYSFQRVEVPALPVHFCDCEEHSVSSYTTKHKQICDEAQSGGINEEELSIMNSVMKKLFERENIPNAAYSEIGVTQEEDNSIISNDDLQFEGNEVDDATDEDNLIINMVTRGNNITDFSGGQVHETILANQESTLNEGKGSKDGQSQNFQRAEKRNIVSPTKKRKALFNEERNRKEILSAITGGKDKLQTHSIASGNLLGAQTVIPESGIKQSNSSLSWTQKSSWKELVGDRGKGVFSMSNLFPGIDSTKEEQPQSDGQIRQDPTDRKNLNLIKHGNSDGESDKSKELEELVEAESSKSEKELEAESSRSDKELEAESSKSDKELEGVEEAESSKSDKELEGLVKAESSKSDKEQEGLDKAESSKSDKELEGLEESVSPKSDKEREGLVKAESSKSDANSKNSGRGASWLQKSTWTELVSENNSSFSISQILPGIIYEKQEPPEFNGEAVLNSTGSKHGNVVKRGGSESVGDVSEVLGIGNEGLLSAPSSSNIVTSNKKLKLADMDVVQSAPENNLQTLTGSKEASTSIVDVEIGETCSFMRSAASLREWATTKAALSGSLKRKGNEK